MPEFIVTWKALVTYQSSVFAKDEKQVRELFEDDGFKDIIEIDSIDEEIIKVEPWKDEEWDYDKRSAETGHN